MCVCHMYIHRENFEVVLDDKERAMYIHTHMHTYREDIEEMAIYVHI